MDKHARKCLYERWATPARASCLNGGFIRTRERFSCTQIQCHQRSTWGIMNIVTGHPSEPHISPQEISVFLRAIAISRAWRASHKRAAFQAIHPIVLLDDPIRSHHFYPQKHSVHGFHYDCSIGWSHFTKHNDFEDSAFCQASSFPNKEALLLYRCMLRL